MGYMCHHAVLVTSWDAELISKAHQKAIELAPDDPHAVTANFADLVTPIMVSVVNLYKSFCIVPDGSKEGWETSDLGDQWRRAFTAWCDEQRYGDNGSALDWVLVQFGDENGDNQIVDSEHLGLERRGGIVG